MTRRYPYTDVQDWESTFTTRIKMHPTVGNAHTHQQLWVNRKTGAKRWVDLDMVAHDAPDEEAGLNESGTGEYPED